jgi:fatty-acyl-CoA synthase
VLLATADGEEGEYVFHLEDGVVRVSCAELAERAERGARRLAALGIGPGDPVGLLGPNRPEWVVWAFATWMAGAVLLPLQVPVRVRDPAAFAESLERVLDVAGCCVVLAEPRLAPYLPSGKAVAWDEDGEISGDAPGGPDPSSTAVIQFTSGSTAAPRGAAIAHGAALAQLGILEPVVSGAVGPRALASWVPFFHDMGLFLSALAPAAWGGTGHYLPTERFARDPVEWLRLVQTTRARLTFGPPAAVGSTLRAFVRGQESIDLGCLDGMLMAAEAVDPAVARRLFELAPRLGLRPGALGTGYGLAEAVLSVAYSPVGAGLTLDTVALDDLARGVAAPAGAGRTRAIASCGPPRMELRIGGTDGAELPERHVGEILVRGASTMSGYLGPSATDPFRDGWLYTGDLGYLASGELYVTGRAKDLVIAMGHNYYPEDFEWAAARVEGVKPGRCVAFALPDSEEVVVLVETDDGEPGNLGQKVRRSIADAVGIAPGRVVVLPPGSVQKTTSGKLKRTAMREAYSRDALATLSP